MLLSIITHRKAWCISKLSVCCTDETSLRFHVWRLDEVLKFARGILKHLWGRLKETEQINHKTNFLLNLQVMINSKSLLCCLSLQQCYKLSQVACNSLLCLIIDRHLASDIISPLFWRPLAKLPLWVFYLCDLMSCRPIRFMYVYVLKVYFCVCVCVWWARSGLSCMLQQAIARNGGFPCNMSDWAGLHYNVPYMSQSNRHKIWLFLNSRIFLGSISIEKSCLSRTEPNLSLYTGPECLANLDIGLHFGSQSDLLSHS